MGDPNKSSERNNSESQGGAEMAENFDVDVDVAQEYLALDSTLNEIDSVLDNLEQRNDNLFEKLEELLQSNRQIRQEIAAQNASKDSDEMPNENEESKNS